jgi:hypothetical protein
MMHKNEISVEDVRKLLSRKRLQAPCPEYFEGVLAEFHRRQRVQILQPRSLIWSWVQDWMERVATAVWTPTVRLAGAGALAVSVLAVGAATLPRSSESTGIASTAVSSPDLLKLESGVAPHQVFAFLESASQTTNVFPTYAEIQDDVMLPHYVLAETPAQYDSTLAF